MSVSGTSSMSWRQVVFFIGALFLQAGVVSATRELDFNPGGAQSLSLEAAEGAAEERTHPPGNMEWGYVQASQAMVCAVLLFFLAIVFSATGVGGGGVYVVALMAAGGVSPHDAVPLSHAVVFASSMASLFVNLHRWHTTGTSHINSEVCKLVVPIALLGSLAGCLMNPHIPDYAVLIVLSTVLPLLAVVVLGVWKQQRTEEELRASWVEEDPAGSEYTHILHLKSEGNVSRRAIHWSDILVSLLLILMVALGCALNHHMGACRTDMSMSWWHGHCRHPLLTSLSSDIEFWLSSAVTAGFWRCFVLAMPACACIAAGNKSVSQYLPVSNETLGRHLISYQLVACVTGVLSGLAGLSGLIFTPFFLMTMEPTVAIVTSSTCVLFTSASAALFYTLVDRMVLSLALVYGLVVFVGSLCGTGLVHRVRAHFPNQKSAITMCVAMVVLLSNVFLFVKVATAMASTTVASA